MPPKYYVSRNTINVLFTLIKYICIMTLQTYAYRCKKRYFWMHRLSSIEHQNRNNEV